MDSISHSSQMIAHRRPYLSGDRAVLGESADGAAAGDGPSPPDDVLAPATCRVPNLRAQDASVQLGDKAAERDDMRMTSSRDRCIVLTKPAVE